MADNIETKRVYLELKPRMRCSVCRRRTLFKLAWYITDGTNGFFYDAVALCPRCHRLIVKLGRIPETEER
jgi:hypothetical protein